MHCTLGECCAKEVNKRSCTIQVDVDVSRGFRHNHAGAEEEAAANTHFSEDPPADWDLWKAVVHSQCSNCSEDCTRKFQESLERVAAYIAWGPDGPLFTCADIRDLWDAVNDPRRSPTLGAPGVDVFELRLGLAGVRGGSISKRYKKGAILPHRTLYEVMFIFGSELEYPAA
ncbi:hypothetical protein LTR36_000579 [Oleoguttula mirabilis]|uniref:Uncharacterized protein n=1 Tax=Oleoguttula mirabilis TaxID=1507867 RepID=A0AAV9JQD6_9PEZI|nr:hypothetical protein LTR36_000579 [Oleoguttula mirabilis]